jgi:Ca2+-binding RTX toxin-like protein
MRSRLVSAVPQVHVARTLLTGSIALAFFLTVGVPGTDAKKPKVTAKVTGTTLVVSGTPNADDIVLALQPGDPTILQVFAGDKLAGNVDRSRFATISVIAGGDDDSVLIDETNGTFTIDAPTTVDGGAGADTLTGDIGGLVLDGGADADTIAGSNGADVILGGDGADTIDGNQGNDAVFAGSGDDVMTWDPGDASDTLEGQDGTDTLAFHGSNIGEIIQVSANGGRALVLRDIANITMDLNDVERVELSTVGGADTIVVNDLTGTDVSDVEVDLAAVGGSGDGQPDTVTVRGTAGDDAITVTGSGTSAVVTGLHASVATIGGAEFALDALSIDAGGGTDTVDASGLAAGVISLIVNGVP